MRLDEITPLILAFNEEANIGRTLEAVAWARRILVIDSGSTDGTLEIVRRFPQAEVMQRKFDTHAAQWNFGLAQVRSPFTLSLDADYRLRPENVAELEALDGSVADGWYAPFRFCIDGRPLRASLLPPRLVLFRTQGACYDDDGHTQRLREPARVGKLRVPLLHDDRKPLARWLEAQSRYCKLESAKLRASAWRDLRWPDRLRRGYLGPLLVPPYCLIARGLILDGPRGWRYTALRTYAEWLLARQLFEHRGPAA